MKDSFLEKIYNEFKNADLSRHCFVFPTRRAAYLFRQRFIESAEKTTWLPEILAVRDLIDRLCTFPVADDLVLLMLLYDVVAEFETDISIDKFFPWGKILLNDFNEIDQNLVNADALYYHSYEQREIDLQFALSETEMEDIAGFWKLFSKKPLSSLQENFLANWQNIPSIYHKFKSLLKKNNVVYEGMAYRILVEQLKEGNLFLPWEQFVFGGFYALSAAEQAIMEGLTALKKASIFWDADSYYLDNPAHEAGLYMRRNDFLKSTFSWKHNCFRDIPKTIHITGAPLQTAQVKWLSNLLKEKIADPSFNQAKTVIVLPDEAMLIPLLYSLPDELNGINITMGYPVKHAHIGNLIQSYIQLHKNSQTSEGEIYFIREDAQSFLSLYNPVFIKEGYLNQSFADSGQLTISSSKLVKHYPAFAWAFSGLDGLQQIKTSLETLIRNYLAQLKNPGTLELTVADFILHAFDELFSTLNHQFSKLTVKMILQLLEEGLLTIKVPFTGEPVKGIQVMGFLETRTLDFDHVFILSVNENFLPATSSGKTYIPYSIRKTFKLPLRNEQDAIYAYHFYRLLQRAKEIHLIYDTQEKKVSGGEMSRYLLQIAFELNESKGYPVKTFYNQVNTEAILIPEREIAIQKNSAVISKLQSLMIKSESNKGISATALAEYVTCSLRFYFRYVARIIKPDEIENEMSGKDFGNILHTAMKMLYDEKSLLQQSDFREIRKRITETLETSVSTVYKKNITTGNDLLLKGVLQKLLEKVTAIDTVESPLEIISLEKTYQATVNITGIGEIALNGNIDRIDIKDGITRIIDYKTGKDNIKPNADFSKLFSNPDSKAMMQLMFYLFIYKFNFPGTPVIAGIYRLQTLNSGIQWLNQGNVITEEEINSFIESMVEIIKDIFNPEIDFLQTEDVNRCEFCNYNKICNRL